MHNSSSMFAFPFLVLIKPVLFFFPLFPLSQAPFPFLLFLAFYLLSVTITLTDCKLMLPFYSPIFPKIPFQRLLMVHYAAFRIKAISPYCIVSLSDPPPSLHICSPPERRII
ncbi:hypothetical protein BJX99DRAFT_67784 [Aspergillus californicus]